MGVIKPISPPVASADHHEVSNFESGEPSLDSWLRKRARNNQKSGASRTYVVCDERRIIAYYALASGAISIGLAPGRLRRNMPDPIPMAVLTRLAVDREWQRQGIGRALVRDAAHRVSEAADIIGIRGILVHAISHEAREFYIALGFDSGLHEPLMLMITLSDIRAALK